MMMSQGQPDKPVAWHCEGCGVRVLAFGVGAAPRHQLCSVCAWCCEFLDPLSAEWDTVTRRLGTSSRVVYWSES